MNLSRKKIEAAWIYAGYEKQNWILAVNEIKQEAVSRLL